MTADLFNGLFEFGGALFILLNIRALLRAKRLEGVHWAPTLFFTAWGVFNLYFYPSLDQWYSFAGGVCIVAVNTVWLWLVWRYRPLTLPQS